MKRRITLLMAALILAATPDISVMADEDPDVIIVADETEFVIAESEETGLESSEEGSGEMLVETVEEVTEDVPATVQDSEDVPETIADSGSCGDNVTWTLSDDGILTISGTGQMRYTSTGPWAENKNIVSVVITDGITNIGAMAFSGCTGITSVIISNTVESIGLRAFYQCSSLETIELPDSVTEIGRGAFAYCDNLKEVVLSDNITEIQESTFYYCYKLQSITMPDSVTSIGREAFYSCLNLSTITIPKNVVTIEYGAFADCISLTSITIPKNVSTIGENVFIGCSSLKSIKVNSNNAAYCSDDGVLYNKDKTELICCPQKKSGTYVIPDSVTTIPEYAFLGCSKLTSITLSKNLSVINEGTFSGCTELTTVTIPDGVTSIGNYAFLDCSSLTSVTIPDSVTKIGEMAFCECDNLTKVSIPASVKSIGENALGKVLDKTTYTYVNKEGFVISGYSNSAAETYANNNNITFVSLGSSTSTVSLSTGKISSLTNVAKGIKIKWSKVSGASGYYIYRKTGSDSYKKIKTISSASTVSYTDKKVAEKNGTTYTYKVVPYSGSTEGSGTEKTTVRLTGTTLTSVKNSAASKAKVKWTAVTDVTGYQIQYSTSSSFSSSKKKTVSGATKSSKTLTGLTKGSTYYVRIRTYKTVNGTKYYSAWSSKLKVTITK